jgi:hypothetical protein
LLNQSSTAQQTAKVEVFTEWLARWLAGTLTQPFLIEDPVTGQWRGTTDEDYRRL